MNVRELIEALKKIDPEMPVVHSSFDERWGGRDYETPTIEACRLVKGRMTQVSLSGGREIEYWREQEPHEKVIGDGDLVLVFSEW